STSSAFSSSAHHRDLRSFPTRRSSDLKPFANLAKGRPLARRQAASAVFAVLVETDDLDAALMLLRFGEQNRGFFTLEGITLQRGDLFARITLWRCFFLFLLFRLFLMTECLGRFRLRRHQHLADRFRVHFRLAQPGNAEAAKTFKGAVAAVDG